MPVNIVNGVQEVKIWNVCGHEIPLFIF